MERELTISFNGKQVIKKYSKGRNHYTRTSFPKSMLKLIVHDALFNRMKTKIICVKYNISEETLNEIIFTYKITGGTFNERIEDIPILGCKEESYYTEEELLNLPPQYSWDEVSETEKQFYFNYGRNNS
jgi:hypothetical protein